VGLAETAALTFRAAAAVSAVAWAAEVVVA
jgi:hypothetical protein